MTRKKERFLTRSPGEVDMFTCGPSIYRPPHLGNYRTFLYEDVLHRYLEYLGFTVRRMLNYTDVEDKAIEEARRRGTDIWSLTGAVASRFEEEARTLRILLPQLMPRSSTTVDQAVRLIERLIDRGHAYRHRGDVFYDPLTFDGFGRLYGLDMSRWPEKRRRFRRDTYPGQRWNRGDFILWHGGGEVAWDTAIGRGRPAWNVQDPAMITGHFGYRIDLSCGGVDNLYRHHDYTIAVIEGVSGEEFCPWWLHGEHLLINGEKMSKEKGNILYPEDLLEQGCDPGEIRFHLIYGHYREKMNLTRESLGDHARTLRSFRSLVNLLCGKSREAAGAFDPPSPSRPAGQTRATAGQDRGSGPGERVLRAFEEGMNDDLDVRRAFDRVHAELRRTSVLRHGNPPPARDRGALEDAVRRIDGVLRVLDP
jgi:cysteinyl-tRNA synthetase